MNKLILCLLVTVSFSAFSQNNSIVGKWELREHFVRTESVFDSINLYSKQFDHIYTFNEDGTWELESNNKIIEGNWKMRKNGKKLIIKCKSKKWSYEVYNSNGIIINSVLWIGEIIPELYSEKKTPETGGTSKLIRITSY